MFNFSSLWERITRPLFWTILAFVICTGSQVVHAQDSAPSQSGQQESVTKQPGDTHQENEPYLHLTPPDLLAEPAPAPLPLGRRLAKEMGVGMSMYLAAGLLVGLGYGLALDGSEGTTIAALVLFGGAAVAVSYGVPWAINKVGTDNGIDGYPYIATFVGLAIASGITLLAFEQFGDYALIGFPFLHVAGTAVAFELTHTLFNSGSSQASGPARINPGVAVSFRF